MAPVDTTYEAVKHVVQVYLLTRGECGYARQELKLNLEQAGLSLNDASELAMRLDFWFDDAYAELAKAGTKKKAAAGL